MSVRGGGFGGMQQGAESKEYHEQLMEQRRQNKESGSSPKHKLMMHAGGIPTGRMDVGPPAEVMAAARAKRRAEEAAERGEKPAEEEDDGMKRKAEEPPPPPKEEDDGMSRKEKEEPPPKPAPKPAEPKTGGYGKFAQKAPPPKEDPPWKKEPPKSGGWKKEPPFSGEKFPEPIPAGATFGPRTPMGTGWYTPPQKGKPFGGDKFGRPAEPSPKPAPKSGGWKKEPPFSGEKFPKPLPAGATYGPKEPLGTGWWTPPGPAKKGASPFGGDKFGRPAEQSPKSSPSGPANQQWKKTPPFSGEKFPENIPLKGCTYGPKTPLGTGFYFPPTGGKPFGGDKFGRPAAGSPKGKGDDGDGMSRPGKDNPFGGDKFGRPAAGSPKGKGDDGDGMSRPGKDNPFSGDKFGRPAAGSPKGKDSGMGRPDKDDGMGRPGKGDSPWGGEKLGQKPQDKKGDLSDFMNRKGKDDPKKSPPFKGEKFPEKLPVPKKGQVAKFGEKTPSGDGWYTPLAGGKGAPGKLGQWGPGEQADDKPKRGVGKLGALPEDGEKDPGSRGLPKQWEAKEKKPAPVTGEKFPSVGACPGGEKALAVQGWPQKPVGSKCQAAIEAWLRKYGPKETPALDAAAKPLDFTPEPSTTDPDKRKWVIEINDGKAPGRTFTARLICHFDAADGHWAITREKFTVVAKEAPAAAKGPASPKESKLQKAIRERGYCECATFEPNVYDEKYCRNCQKVKPGQK